MKTALYAEPPETGNPHRARMLAEVNALVRARQRAAAGRRRQFFKPDYASPEAHAASLAAYREALRAILGWPLTEPAAKATPAARLEPVGEDRFGRIWRVWIDTLPGVRTYGLFFKPRGPGRFPLVIAQHGGQGTPELCSGFFGDSNYNDMTRRVLARGCAVFAPQLMLWDPQRFGPDPGRELVDRRLKQTGGSLAALELTRLIRALDHFAARPDIDASRIGMVGLSYGGFYTLFAAALDTRIRVAVSSCFLNNRTVYDFADWSWFDAANRMLDAEVGALVCPRPLYVEVGVKDALFDVRKARPVARQLARHFAKAGAADRFRYVEHPGGHEFARGDGGIDFLCEHLGVTGPRQA